jgi:hypothetical protein
MVQNRFRGHGKSASPWGTLAAMGASFLMLGGLLGPLASPAQAQPGDGNNPPHFTIDPATPLKDLLPAAPDATALTPPWKVQDFAQVPEVLFQKGEAIRRLPRPRTMTPEEEKQAMLREQEAFKKTAHLIAKINHVNQKGTDRFVKALRDSRDDLAGLPFLLGDACRLSKERSRAFVTGVSLARDSQRVEHEEKPPARDPITEANKFWIGYRVRNVWTKDLSPDEQAESPDSVPARIAALMQVLGPEDKAFRQGLVKYLSGIDHAEATLALARLAVFSFEEEVRQPALAALKTRSQDAASNVLMAGLRYPWPAVVQNAGDAIAQLGRKDLIPQLVALLDEPDPRAPVEIAFNARKTPAVREVVRLNHLRSCLLCHPPGKEAESADVVTGPVPSPGQSFQSPFQAYDRSNIPPDQLARADVTYLRQDFSLLQPLKDADPRPEMQRFDFLVRTRPVSATAAAEYQDWLRQQGAGYLAPHRRAAVAALRTLTGRDAPEPTANAWRSVLEH